MSREQFSSKSFQEKDTIIDKLKSEIEELENKLQMETGKLDRTIRELTKKEQTMRNNYENQLSDLKEENRIYKSEV